MSPFTIMSETLLPPIVPTDVPDQSPHYVHAVTEMGEDRDIVAHEDIYAANGMKLFAKGARIDRTQFERLNLHKLRAPLDQSLSAAHPVNVDLLAIEANRLLSGDPVLSRMAQRAGDPLSFRRTLGMMPLPEPISFRLTVMRDQRNDLFVHSLRIALISHSVAVRLGMSDQQKEDLLLAALCHDLGEMHTDPALLEASHRIAPDERRYIHVHPVTSYVLLRDLPDVSPATQQAVLQHHERLDGSGYPHGLTQAQIHPIAKPLCLAEALDAVLRRGDMQHVDVLLRLNRNRLDPDATGVLRELFRITDDETAVATAKCDACERMHHLVAVLRAWREQRGRDGMASAGDLGFVRERMDLLRSLALQAGIDQDDTAPVLNVAGEDCKVMQELLATLDELDWQMHEIANEIVRRAPTSGESCRRLITLLTES